MWVHKLVGLYSIYLCFCKSTLYILDNFPDSYASWIFILSKLSNTPFWRSNQSEKIREKEGKEFLKFNSYI